MTLREWDNQLRQERSERPHTSLGDKEYDRMKKVVAARHYASIASECADKAHRNWYSVIMYNDQLGNSLLAALLAARDAGLDPDVVGPALEDELRKSVYGRFWGLDAIASDRHY